MHPFLIQQIILNTYNLIQLDNKVFLTNNGNNEVSLAYFKRLCIFIFQTPGILRSVAKWNNTDFRKNMSTMTINPIRSKLSKPHAQEIPEILKR